MDDEEKEDENEGEGQQLYMKKDVRQGRLPSSTYPMGRQMTRTHLEEKRATEQAVSSDFLAGARWMV